MLKFENVLNILNSAKVITCRINKLLNDSVNENVQLIDEDFAKRKIIIRQLNEIFIRNDIANYSKIQKDLINKILSQIIDEDNQNLKLINSKMQNLGDSLKKLTQQKSLLIYNKF